MRKGVANLFRYREVSLMANRRYLEALAVVDDPTPAIQDLDRITQRRRTSAGQSVKAFNPLAREDRQLFEALASGEHHVRGITNHDLRFQARRRLCSSSPARCHGCCADCICTG
jgi:hypothetical protein